jgi:hypothetical protein
VTADEVRRRAAAMRLSANYIDAYGDYRRAMARADAWEARELARIDAAPARPDAADMALVGLDLPTVETQR